jgi:hypothetical protein
MVVLCCVVLLCLIEFAFAFCCQPGSLSLPPSPHCNCSRLQCLQNSSTPTMEALNIIPAKVEAARAYCNAGEYEDALVQYEGALVLLKDLINNVPDDAANVR